MPVLQCLGGWDVLIKKHPSVHPITGTPCALPQATQLVGTTQADQETQQETHYGRKSSFQAITFWPMSRTLQFFWLLKVPGSYT